MYDVAGAIRRIENDFWPKFYASSRLRSSRYHKREWWHGKLYVNNPPNDGNALQTVLHRQEQEIPQLRDYFWPAPSGRFSLRSDKVAYFSEDFAVTCCETIDQFHDNPSTRFNDLLLYFRERSNQQTEWFGHPLPIRLAETAIIADLSSTGSSLVQALASSGILGSSAALFEGVILSWDLEARLATQAIACKLAAEGFSGLAYRSVRVPDDGGLRDMNLVLFDPGVVIRDPWDRTNPRAFKYDATVTRG